MLGNCCSCRRGCAMRTTAFLLVLLTFTLLASLQVSAQAVPVSPRRGPDMSSRDVPNYDMHSAGNEFEIAKASGQPSPAAQKSAGQDSAYTAKLRHDADELAYLAQSIPTDVDKTTKGLLPQDLAKKLKRIQELSKELRTNISR
jgi:hypothetical protein